MTRRRELVERTWTEYASYLDPLMAGEGHDGIDGMIAQAQQKYPGHRFELCFGPAAHNDRVRFAWHLFGPDAEKPVATGTDFGTVAADGRLKAVAGFLESPAG